MRLLEIEQRSGEDGSVVAGQRFSLSALTSYDPVMADEIQASIEESLLR